MSASERSTGGAQHEISSRVHSVIEAAERAADAIREDAETQAQRYLAEARDRADRFSAERLRLIGELSDELLSDANAVREQSARMLATLERAIEATEERLAQLAAEPPERDSPDAEGAIDPADQPSSTSRPASR